MQNRHTEIASLLIKAGADISVRWATFGTARDIAESYECTALVETIDAELDRQLRARFVGFCDALSATKLPVLVVLESFAWFAATIYAGQIIELPLKWQWHVAKSIRDRALERLESRE